MLNFLPYTNLVEIDHGGMSTVYRATAPNGNLVVLKVLAMHLASDRVALARFKQETNLGLIHPNIVRVLDGGVKDGAPYIVMDYIVGESLDRRLLRVGTLKPRALAPIIRDVANALEYAHGKSIIHRDVKPSNILIRPTGQALLVDFGVAKSSSATAYTATAARVGSVFYMSPEQANGEPVITYASDIYSLGITCYYALTGRHPFEADNEIAVARMHIDAKPRHVSEINSAVPRSVGNVVMQALEKDPQRRHKSASEFAQAFEQAIAKANLSPGRSRRLPVMLAVAAGLIVLALLAYALFRFLPGQPMGVDLTPLPAVSLPATPEQLSVKGSPPGTSTATPVPAPSNTPTVPPTEVDTKTPEPTDTPASTQTPIIIIRYRTIVVTGTPLPTRIQPRPTARPTRTPQPPAATYEVPTATYAPSVTPPPMTITSTPLPTVMSTATPVPTATPSLVPLPTKQPVPSATAQPPARTATPTVTPPATAR